MSDTPLTDAMEVAITITYVPPKVFRLMAQLERDRTRLLSALERLHLATCLILQSKPVRDMDEALSEATSAIAKAQVKP